MKQVVALVGLVQETERKEARCGCILRSLKTQMAAFAEIVWSAQNVEKLLKQKLVIPQI